MVSRKSALSVRITNIPVALAFIGLLLLTILGPGMEMTTILPHDMTRNIRQVVYPLLLLTVVISLKLWRNHNYFKVIPIPLIITFIWCLLSLTWSAVPDIAAKRLLLTSIATALAFLCIRTAGYTRSVLIVRSVLLGALVINFLVVFLFPSVGTHDYGISWSKGQWRGLMGHKNVAGVLCGITMLFYAFDSRRISFALRYSVVAVAGIFLFYTNSRTSLAMVALAATVGFIVTYFHSAISKSINGPSRRIIINIGLALCVIIFGTLVYYTINQDALLAYTGDANALSKRMTIWQPLLRFYIDHPVLGAGFGSFWDTQPQSTAREYGGGWLRQVYQGHNGYLDLLVQIGLPGLLLALVAVVVWPVIMLSRLLSSSPDECGLVIAILIFCLGDNMMETTLLARDTPGQTFLMIALAMIVTVGAERANRRSRSRRVLKGSGARGVN